MPHYWAKITINGVETEFESNYPLGDLSVTPSTAKRIAPPTKTIDHDPNERFMEQHKGRYEILRDNMIHDRVTGHTMSFNQFANFIKGMEKLSQR